MLDEKSDSSHESNSPLVKQETLPEEGEFEKKTAKQGRCTSWFCWLWRSSLTRWRKSSAGWNLPSSQRNRCAPQNNIKLPYPSPPRLLNTCPGRPFSGVYVTKRP